MQRQSLSYFFKLGGKQDNFHPTLWRADGTVKKLLSPKTFLGIQKALTNASTCLKYLFSKELYGGRVVIPSHISMKCNALFIEGI